MRWKRLAVLVAMAAVAVVVVLAVRPRPIAVDVATVQRGPFERVVEAEGRTDLPDRVLVTAPVAGQMLAIRLRAGDDVTQDAVLTEIEPLPLPLVDPAGIAEATDREGLATAQQRQARAEVTRADATLQQARDDLKRLRILGQAGAVGSRDVARASADVRAAEAGLQAAKMAAHAAEHAVAVARALRARTLREAQPQANHKQVVASPLTGRILRVLRDDAGVVAAGEPLVELANPASLEVVLDVPSEDAVSLQPGQPATLHGWGGTQPLRASVRRVEPHAVTRLSALGVEEQRVDVRLDLLPGPSTALGDGYHVEAKVVVDRRPDALLAPTAALWRDGTGWAVYVLRAGRAERRAVVPGLRDAERFVVEQGLQAGEQVIVHPPEAVRDGVDVAATAR